VQVARLVEKAQVASSAAEAARSAMHAELKTAELRCNTTSQKLLRSTESNYALRKELAALVREVQLERSLAQETIEELEDELDALQREVDVGKDRTDRSVSVARLWQAVVCQYTPHICIGYAAMFYNFPCAYVCRTGLLVCMTLYHQNFDVCIAAGLHSHQCVVQQ
jgi:hypothetical protein